MIYVVPAIALIAFVLAAIKKVSVYDSFIAGTREAAALTVSLIPYLAAVYMLMENKIQGYSFFAILYIV